MRKVLIEEIANHVTLGSLHVDRAESIVRNVKIIGFESANGRTYTADALKEAISMYEGVNVNIDHPEGDPGEQRSAWDRIGFLRNVRFVEGKGLYGDLHLLPSHPFTERILEAAEKMPQIYGLSHNARGEGYEDKKTGKFVVNRVAEVRHVDLVADPATTHSLAESASQQKTEEAAYSGVGYKSKKRDPGARRGYTKAKEKSRMTRISPKESEDGLTSEQGKYDKLHAKIIDVLTHGMTPDSQKAERIIDIFNKHKEDGTMDDEEKRNNMMKAEEAVADDTDDSVDDAEEAEGKICEKCKAKMECCGESDEEAEEAKAKGGSSDSPADDDNEDEPSDDGASDSADESEESEESEEAEDDVEDGDKKKKQGMYSGKESKDSKPNKRGIRELCESNKLKADDSLINDLMEMPESVAKRVVQRLANAERLLKPKSAVKVESQKATGIDALEGKQIFNWLKN